MVNKSYPNKGGLIILHNKQGWIGLLRWFVAGLGSGWLPKAPGTWGSLAALPVGVWVIFSYQWQGLLLASVGLLILGCAACVPVLKTMEEQDPGWIVVDEWVGQWICTALLVMDMGLSWQSVALSFVVFRLFDIWKPFPIRQLEHWGPAWWSIMLDDVVAGLMGAASVILLVKLWLGGMA